MQVLEVTMAGIALAGAAILLAATEDPTDGGASRASDVRQQAQDLLDVLAQREAPDNASANLLAHEIAHARQGQEDLRRHVDRYFPHQDWSLATVNEDGGVADVAASGAPAGVVTTGTRPLVPGWTYSWEDPRMDVYSGEYPMQVASVPVHNSQSARLAGAPVKVSVTVEDMADEKEYHVYETLARPSKEEPRTTVLGTRSGDSGASVSFTSDYIQSCQGFESLTATEFTCEFVLRFVEVHGPGLSEGTELEIDVPRNWRFNDFGGPGEKWEVVTPKNSKAGPVTVLLRVEEGSTIEENDEITFSLNVTADPLAPFSTFEARLANGTLSRAEIVVPHPGSEAKAPRAVYTSLPYPAQAGGTSRWGIGFSNGLSETTITEVAVESVDGTPLFAAVDTVDPLVRNCLTPTCGRIQVSPDGTRITWSGEETVLQGEARDLILDVGATGETTNVTRAERRAYPEVHFDNGHTHHLTRQVGAPGLYTARIPPEADVLGDGPAGYPTPSTTDGLLDGEAHTFPARLDYWPRGELWKVDSNFTYTVDPGVAADELVLDTQGAVSASRIETTPGTTTPGGVVWAHVNASNVLTEVAAQDGQDVSLTTRLYTPPTLGEEPAHEVRTNLSGAGAGEPVTGVLAADATGDGDREAVLGADDGRVHAYDVAPANLDQTLLWSRDVAGTPRALASGVGGDGMPRVYAGDDAGTVTALDPAGGASWTHDTGAGPVDDLHPWRRPDATATEGVWAVHEPPADGAGDEGLRWSLLTVDRSLLAPSVTTAATSDEGGDDGAAALLGPDLATAVASEGMNSARTWVNVTGPEGDPGWSTALGTRYEEVADAVALDADGDGGPDLAVALVAADSSGAVVLLDGDDGEELGRFEAMGLAALAPVGDATDAPGEELAYATHRNRVGVLAYPRENLEQAWARDVEPAEAATEIDGVLPASTESAVGWTGCGRANEASCVLQRTGEAGGVPPRPVSLDVVGRYDPGEGPVLAFTYTRGLEPAGTATGTVAYHDLATGAEAGSSEVPPTAGTPVAADGDAVPWLAVGTDRGHLVVADAGPVEPTHSQAADDRVLFHVPVAVEEGAFYGTYVVDVEITWSAADLPRRQTVHLVSRFSVQPESDDGRSGFVYDTKLNVAPSAGH